MAKKPAKSAAKGDESAPRARARREPRAIELKPDSPPPGLKTPAPVTLGSIVGQDRAIDVLRRSVGSGRLHHAWVFHGPAGVGKLTTAIALAAMLLDPTTAPGLSGELEPDPDSQTQRLLRAGTHPDLHVITKELAAVSREASTRDSKQRNIAKDVLEEFLIEPATRSASASTGAPPAMAAKVFIVDEAELIDIRGQNALLKTLEEPAPGRVLILVTSREERLLPTIRSRCQRVSFVPLDDAAMRAWLKGSGLETSHVDQATLDWLLAFADGSPGVLSLALSTGLGAWHAAIAPMLSQLDTPGRFPVDLPGTMNKLIDDWAVKWVASPGNENASKDAANKAAARLMFRYLGQHYRGALRRADDDGAREPALRAIDLLAEAERQVESNVQPVFVLENLAAQIAITPRG